MFEPYRPRKLEEAVQGAPQEETVADDYARWQPRDIGQGTARSAAAEAPSEQGQQRQDGYQEGFQQGLADGQRQARELLAQQTQQLQSAMSALREPAQWIDHQLESEMLSLTLNLAQQLLRYHIDVAPQRLVHIIKEAVSRLPVTNSPVTIHLNPADYTRIQALNPQADEHEGASVDPSWRWIEDASVSEGGSMIHCGDSLIDDTVEHRLAGLVERMLREEPQQDDNGGNSGGGSNHA